MSHVSTWVCFVSCTILTICPLSVFPQTDVPATFSPIAYYTDALNPNAAGYEAWEVDVPVSVGATTLEYAVHLKYEGSSYEIW